MNLLSWITQNLRGELPAPWLEAVLALVAVACGAMIGTERERHDKPAGLRTLILVCLGSSVFTMVSFAFSSTTGDSGRVAAQIVTGIGFLGAGVILHSRTGITGMTTAATIWMTAAIGMTIGAGWPGAGLGLSLLVRMVLAGVLKWEIRHLGGMKSVAIEVFFDPDHGKTRIKLERIRDDYHVVPIAVQYSDAGEGRVRALVNLSLPRRQLHEFLDALVALPALREIRELPVGYGSAANASQVSK
jgi:putative Mg2+ transporter-C (MgtC) family protein